VDSQSCMKTIWQRVRSSFLHLLTTNEWPLSAFGISAIVTFSTNLDEAHQPMLRRCIPKSKMEFLKCRAMSKVWRGEGSGLDTESDVIAIMNNVGRQLHRHCSSRKETGQSVFPPAATKSIVAGSYFVEMPTPGGLTATVIFPPGPQSLEDIRYMADAEEHSNIRILKRSISTSSGNIKCFLQNFPQI
jgi:hypothetical protein